MYCLEDALVVFCSGDMQKYNNFSIFCLFLFLVFVNYGADETVSGS